MKFPAKIKSDTDYFQNKERTLKTKETGLEEAVLTVLDAELAIWRKYAGRLGSIQTYYKGLSTRGIGTEWREPESCYVENLPEPERGSVISENAEALLTIYDRLSDPLDQLQFVALLLSHLSDRAKYASVGYLILLVLFRIGRLPQALECALSGLSRDKAYGFSDFLRLLDGLLRFEHHAFRDDWITAVNLFIDAIDGHTFRIWYRVAALKGFRLANA